MNIGVNTESKESMASGGCLCVIWVPWDVIAVLRFGSGQDGRVWALPSGLPPVARSAPDGA